MARLIINNKELKGHLSASTKIDKQGNVIMSGEFYTHKYIDDITTVETDRYKFENVDVHSFSIGSNDFFIRYDFDCELCDITMKGGETNLPESIIKEVESELFKHEEDEKFHIKKQ